MRLGTLEKWTKKGGVFLIGYTMFARLVQGVGIKNKSIRARFNKCLLGADVVICDEGHLLKNEKTNIAKAVYQVSIWSVKLLLKRKMNTRKTGKKYFEKGQVLGISIRLRSAY